MSKPDDIPQGIWDSATYVYDCINPEAAESTIPVSRIARAILAERERCAAVARACVGQTDYDIEPEAAVAESVTAKWIEYELMNPSP